MRLKPLAFASALAASCIALSLPAAPQEKKTSSQKPPSKSVGKQTPELQLAAPTEIFARAFEHYKKGNHNDAEELFLAGLKQDDKDPRAWEWLARAQLALNKNSDAERSIEEAMRRGLPKDRAEQLLLVISSTALPDRIPSDLSGCLSPEAHSVLAKIRGPKATRAFDIEYMRTVGVERREWTIQGRYVPITPGIHSYERTNMTPGMSRPTSMKLFTILGGFLSCGGDRAIVSLRVEGEIFPLRQGAQFTVERQERFKHADMAKHGLNVVINVCTVAEAIKAGPDALPTHPSDGVITTVNCEVKSKFADEARNTKVARMFSSHLGLFVPQPQPGLEHTYRINIH